MKADSVEKWEKAHAFHHYNEKRMGLIRKGQEITWLPFSWYCDMLWLRRVTEPFVWPRGYWVQSYRMQSANITLILDGDMEVTFENRTCLAGKGDIVIRPPGNTRSATGPSGTCKAVYCIPDGTLFQRVIAQNGFDRLSVLHSPESFRSMLALYREIAALHRARDVESIPRISALTYEFILLAAAGIPRAKYPEALRIALEYIENHLSSRLTLHEVSLVAGCGKTVLKELFSEYLHTSPGRHVTQLRMKMARHLLEDELIPVKRIADLCGYESQFYFSNVFKAHFGVSPRFYRRAYLLKL